MSQSIIAANGAMNPCFVYYLRFVDCIRRETYFDLMCRDQIDDFTEIWYANESKKLKILSFPHFDDKSDSFVDDTLPQTADTFFGDDNKMKDFFEIKKFVPHVEEKSGHSH